MPKRSLVPLGLFALVAGILLGCNGDPAGDAGLDDSAISSSDSRSGDAKKEDGTKADSKLSDSSVADDGRPDGAVNDSGVSDSSVDDSGQSDASTPDPFPTQASKANCLKVGRWLCEARAACGGTTVEGCLNSFVNELCEDYYVTGALDLSKVTYRPQDQKVCAEAFLQAPCDKLRNETFARPARCTFNFASLGARAKLPSDLGDPCRTSSDCSRGYCKNGASCPRLCTAFAEAGDSCDALTLCESGSSCVNGSCVKKPTAGQTCDPNVGCLGSLACVSDGADHRCVGKRLSGQACTAKEECVNELTCTSSNVCGPYAAGAACTKRGDQCTGNTLCMMEDPEVQNSPFRCLNRRADQANCARHEECADGLACQDKDPTDSGGPRRCAAPLAENAPCKPGDRCQQDLTCASNGSGSDICQPRGAEGETCFASVTLCRSEIGLCTSSACERGLRCLLTTAGSTARACTATPGQENDPCSSTLDCGANLSCLFDGGFDQRFCLPLGSRPAGQPCSTGAVCEGDLICGGISAQGVGSCTERIAVGQNCTAQTGINVCQTGAFCDGGVCKTGPAVGLDCATGSICAPGAACEPDSGKCIAQPAPGSPCDSNLECGPGFSCGRSCEKICTL